MRAKEFTIETALGTAPKRPAREGSRPIRGHETEPRYKELDKFNSPEEFAKDADYRAYRAGVKASRKQPPAPIKEDWIDDNAAEPLARYFSDLYYGDFSSTEKVKLTSHIYNAIQDGKLSIDQLKSDIAMLEKEKGLNEFAPGGTMKPPAPPTAKKKDPFEDDDRSQLLMSIKNLLDKGAKIDSYLFGARGHITGVANDYFGFYFKKLNKPHSKSSFVRPMDGEDDESYMLKLVKPGYYQLWDKSIADAGEQGVAEGNPWANVIHTTDIHAEKAQRELKNKQAVADSAKVLKNHAKALEPKEIELIKKYNLFHRGRMPEGSYGRLDDEKAEKLIQNVLRFNEQGVAEADETSWTANSAQFRKEEDMSWPVKVTLEPNADINQGRGRQVKTMTVTGQSRDAAKKKLVDYYRKNGWTVTGIKFTGDLDEQGVAEARRVKGGDYQLKLVDRQSDDDTDLDDVVMDYYFDVYQNGQKIGTAQGDSYYGELVVKPEFDRQFKLSSFHDKDHPLMQQFEKIENGVAEGSEHNVGDTVNYSTKVAGFSKSAQGGQGKITKKTATHYTINGKEMPHGHVKSKSKGVAEDVSRLSDEEYNRVVAYVRKKYPGTQLSGLGRNPDGSFNVMIDTGSGRHEFKVRFREPEETKLDELSPQTLRSYIKKSKGHSQKYDQKGNKADEKGDEELANKMWNKGDNRYAGAEQARAKLAGIDEAIAQMEAELVELAEHGKASRELCKSSKSDADLGASMLASCKSQGLRARDGNKSHKLGKSPKSRVKVGGHRIKGQKYGGPLPDWS